MTQNKTGEWICSNAEYHADDAISHSSLEVFRRWSPTFAARYIFKTERAPEPSDEMILGTMFHQQLLEPDTVDWLDAPINPKTGRAYGSDTNAFRDYQQANPGRLILHPDDRRRLDGMLAAVERNADVMNFLNCPQRRELGLRWVDDETGIACRCRPDILSDAGIIVDFKTSSDPTEWLKQAANFGYHRQAAWYQVGVSCALFENYQLPPFVHVVVGSKPPHAVIVYQLGERSLELGREQNEADLMRLADCRRTGDWSDPRESGIQFCDLPSWAFPRKEW